MRHPKPFLYMAFLSATNFGPQKNENHLEEVLAKLHPGTRVEEAAEEF